MAASPADRAPRGRRGRPWDMPACQMVAGTAIGRPKGRLFSSQTDISTLGHSKAQPENSRPETARPVLDSSHRMLGYVLGLADPSRTSHVHVARQVRVTWLTGMRGAGPCTSQHPPSWTAPCRGRGHAATWLCAHVSPLSPRRPAGSRQRRRSPPRAPGGPRA